MVIILEEDKLRQTVRDLAIFDLDFTLDLGFLLRDSSFNLFTMQVCIFFLHRYVDQLTLHNLVFFQEKFSFFFIMLIKETNFMAISSGQINPHPSHYQAHPTSSYSPSLPGLSHGRGVLEPHLRGGAIFWPFCSVIKMAYLAVFRAKNSKIPIMHYFPTISPPLKHHKNTLEIIFGHFQTISDPIQRVVWNTEQNGQKIAPP